MVQERSKEEENRQGTLGQTEKQKEQQSMCREKRGEKEQTLREHFQKKVCARKKKDVQEKEAMCKRALWGGKENVGKPNDGLRGRTGRQGYRQGGKDIEREADRTGQDIYQPRLLAADKADSQSDIGQTDATSKKQRPGIGQRGCSYQ